MRKNGYKMLPENSYLKEKDGGGANYGFWIYYNHNEYYFKVGTKFELYAELFYSEIAKLLCIPTLSYDLAEFKGLSGVISKNFNVNNEKTINMFELLDEYTNFMRQNIDLFEESPWITNIYNLENVWWALSYHYKNHPKKNMIIKRLMSQLTKHFLFQILSFNSDLNYGNLLLLDGKNPQFAPCFDYGRCGLVGFSSLDSTYSFFPNHHFLEKREKLNVQIITEFLNMSCSHYILEFERYLNILIQKDFNEIIRKIEIQTKCLMEEEVKEYLVGNYQEKLLKVQSILNENVEYKRAKIT